MHSLWNLKNALILQTLMVSEFPAKHDSKYSVLSTYPDQHSCEVALVYTKWLLFYLVVMMIIEKLKLHSWFCWEDLQFQTSWI